MPLHTLKESLGQVPGGAGAGANASAVAGKTSVLWTAGGLGSLAVAALLWMTLTEEPSPATPLASKTSGTAQVQNENQPQAAAASVETSSTLAAGSEPKSSSKISALHKHVVPAQEIRKGKTALNNDTIVVGKGVYAGKIRISTKGRSHTGGIAFQGDKVLINPATRRITISSEKKKTDAGEGEKVFGDITLLELPREVEQKLGIEVSEKGILYERLSRDSVEGLVRLEVTVSGGQHSVMIGEPAIVVIGNPDDFPFRLGTDSSKLKVPVTPFLPLYVTTRNGERKVMYSTDGEDKRKFEAAYFNELLNSMIPVLVKANNQAKDEAIFWFAATPDFLLNYLPAAARLTLAQEYDFRKFNVVVETKEPASDSVAATALGSNTQMKYFESGKGSLSSIQYAVVFPNPAKDWVNLSMSLKREEEMQVRLVDINGRLVKVLSPFRTYTMGAVTEKFSITGYAKGLYILMAETKTGYRHTQRILIE